MRQSVKMSILVALVITTVGLSVALFDLTPADAQLLSQTDAWIADDAPMAVKALFGTQSYSYLDQVFMPGMHRNDVSSMDASLNIKAYKNKAPKITHRNGAMTYKSFRPELKVPYVPKNGYPKIEAKPDMKTGGIQLNGLDDFGRPGDTKFKTPDGRMKSKISGDSFTSERDARMPNKFAYSLKPKMLEGTTTQSSTKNKLGMFPITSAQAKAFKMRIEAAKRAGDATASAIFGGSRNDKPAVFVPIVRVRDGMVTDFRITVR